jgi:hypothetical protein
MVVSRISRIVSSRCSGALNYALRQMTDEPAGIIGVRRLRLPARPRLPAGDATAQGQGPGNSTARQPDYRTLTAIMISAPTGQLHPSAQAARMRFDWRSEVGLGPKVRVPEARRLWPKAPAGADAKPAPRLRGDGHLAGRIGVVNGNGVGRGDHARARRRGTARSPVARHHHDGAVRVLHYLAADRAHH